VDIEVVQLNGFLPRMGDENHPANAELYVNVHPPKKGKTIYFLILAQDLQYITPVNTAGTVYTPAGPESVWIDSTTTQDYSKPSAPYGQIQYTFYYNSWTQNNGVFQATLPTLGSLEQWPDTYSAESCQPKGLSFWPIEATAVVDNDATAYLHYDPLSCPGMSEQKQRFYNPASFTAHEELDENLLGYHDLTASPSNAVIGQNVSWVGGAGLQGIVEGIPGSQVDLQNTETFFAGVSAAIGGAALVGLIQEVRTDADKKQRASRRKVEGALRATD
jgi:hypothetical protein